MRSRELIGKEVIDAAARNVGKVKDVEIDPLKWNVTGIIVTTGFMRSRTVSPGDIDKVGDKIVLKVAADKMQKA
ncbi:MAG: PRC-barrel domain-containing protein [Chloroflexi bacterium]|jgi:sporulation protein YlmC with PRC-barrel domain|nr:PRC-barrel domain-containing protein [Chloroflexota bacterium]